MMTWMTYFALSIIASGMIGFVVLCLWLFLVTRRTHF
jgi:hypothetical protein